MLLPGPVIDALRRKGITNPGKLIGILYMVDTTSTEFVSINNEVESYHKNLTIDQYSFDSNVNAGGNSCSQAPLMEETKISEPLQASKPEEMGDYLSAIKSLTINQRRFLNPRIKYFKNSNIYHVGVVDVLTQFNLYNNTSAGVSWLYSTISYIINNKPQIWNLSTLLNLYRINDEPYESALNIILSDAQANSIPIESKEDVQDFIFALSWWISCGRVNQPQDELEEKEDKQKTPIRLTKTNRERVLDVLQEHPEGMTFFEVYKKIETGGQKPSDATIRTELHHLIKDPSSGVVKDENKKYYLKQ
jgi:hypothetical protein